ncbi:hypothetical protein [Streptomyces clavifer]|uniref:hypothetical protein n=1 Tax=Streptomyces clavifer TaxID=68188 RepID=UPI0033B7D067
MDQHDSPAPSWRPESDTPIYDRLLAEWREAAEGPERMPRPAPRTHSRSVLVPGARTSGEVLGGRG